MALLNLSGLRDVFRRGDRDRFERFNIVIAILLAGWVPSILMLVVSYTILTNTLESKILRDRQTFVQLMAHLVGDDLSRTGAIIEYYQTQPDLAKIFSDPTPGAAAHEWLNQRFYSHPRIDGMFLIATDGTLIGSIPAVPQDVVAEFPSTRWLESIRDTPGAHVSPVHPRLSDKRMTADIVGAVQTPDGTVVGYLGVSVLVERMGRRLSSIEFADRSVCQVIDQTGAALFTNNFQSNTAPVSAQATDLIQEIRDRKTGHLERYDNLYSFSLIESTGWEAVMEQPKAAAYKPVRDLLGRITIPAVWLILLTAVGAWLAGKFTRRQAEAARRIEREVVFNEKILANMPSGIALVDPNSRHFLQANDAFALMAKTFGGLLETADVHNITYDEVKIAPADAIERVLAFGAPFQLVEQPFTDRKGMTHFVNVNLLRLQGAERIQGVLYLIEDKTRDVTLRQELIGANAAKDQFLALLSHELRNPLSPVIAMVGELEASAPDSPDVRHALAVIRRNVELEARLIDDLLDVTRISKGKLQLSLESVSVHEILQRAYEICREEILAKNLRMEFRFRAEFEYVEGDSARLQQVFWNLIKNSVKFTPEQGRIIIETFNPTPDLIEIRTTDTGIGIEPEKIGKIFNAFEQGQSSITRRFGGLGLGLAISKAMVSAHRGTLAVASEGQDRGATFTVTLGTVPSPVRAESVPAVPISRSGSLTRNQAGQQPHRLLVVDDHYDTCTGMKMMLERRGYNVIVAHTANEAIEKAQQHDFDLMISDIGLPDRSGYELMEDLKARKNLPGIALSGFGMENDVNRARAAGFAEHLTKPINFDRLEEVIHSLLDLQPAAASEKE